MKEKTVILGACLLGILAVGHGMANKQHTVFVIGLVLFVAGYLMFRKKLKAHIREKYPSGKDRGKREDP